MASASTPCLLMDAKHLLAPAAAVSMRQCFVHRLCSRLRGFARPLVRDFCPLLPIKKI